jgi:hypothetical protein
MHLQDYSGIETAQATCTGTLALPTPGLAPDHVPAPAPGPTAKNNYIRRPLRELTATWHGYKNGHGHGLEHEQKYALNRAPVITTIRRIDQFIGEFPYSQLSLLEGRHEFMFNMVARIMINTIKNTGRDVVYIDGGNSLDPYLLTAACRLFKLDADRILRRIQVARAFTVFQMDTLLTQSLANILERVQPKLVIVSCISELYLDRDVDWNESKSLFTSGFESLEALTKEHDIATILTDFGRDKSIHRFELARRLRAWLAAENRFSLKRPSTYRLRLVKGTGKFLDYLPLPPYQWSLDDFCPGGDLCG